MAQRQFEPEQLLGIRDMLETILHCLDEAGLQRVAIHVDMALSALDREQPHWATNHPAPAKETIARKAQASHRKF